MDEKPADKVVTVSGMYTFRVGEMFPSYEELEKRLELHCSESLVYYWRRDTRTVKGACRKTSRIISNKLKYYSLRYACVFGGEKKKCRSQGKRNNNKSLRNDCPSFIMLRASKDGLNLEVVGVNNDHNHECSNSVNQNLPHQRKLPEDVKQEVVEMMLLHIDRKKIIEYVKKKTNKSVTVKDLFNLKAKYKKFHFKLERTKDEILESMGLSPSTEELYEDEFILEVEDEGIEQMGMCYDENVIEYDEDDANVEIDVEVDSENLVEFADKVEWEEVTLENTDTDLHGNQKQEEDAFTVPDYANNELNSFIQVDHEPEQLATPQQQLNASTSRKQQVNRSLRHLRLKCFIQRENNRLKKKLLNCRICGTNSRFLDMQIRLLQAERKKLLEETSILRSVKEKLINQVTFIESDIIVQ